jgi:3-deoxy-D-manno-octulosonic-acid transferase
MTPAGRDAAGRRLNGRCQLAPFDHPGAVRAFIACIRPVLLIITETELWPNFFLQSAAAGAKIALINARLSTRSMRGYRLIRPLIARALRRADVILAQTAGDAERFRSLGALPQRLAVSGNAKYEVLGDSPPLTPALASFAEGRPILVAGSTAPGEEQFVLTAYRHLLERFPSLALVLAPRHLQRIDEVERMLQRAELPYLRASRWNSLSASRDDQREAGPESTIDSPISGAPDQGQARWVRSGDRAGSQGARSCREVWRPSHSQFRVQVLLLDTMGDLRALYQRAAVAFIGGSLRPGRGGQSLAEPANASVPVLFGPYYENHRQLGDALIAAASGTVVREPIQLAEASAHWLADEPARIVAGQRARSVLEQVAGSSTTIVRYLSALLPTA